MTMVVELFAAVAIIIFLVGVLVGLGKREQPLDNIIVKGFEISDVEVKSSERLSDHKMLSCNLRFLEGDAADKRSEERAVGLVFLRVVVAEDDVGHFTVLVRNKDVDDGAAHIRDFDLDAVLVGQCIKADGFAFGGYEEFFLFHVFSLFIMI